MTQYVRPGQQPSGNSGSVIQILQPAPGDVVEDIIYIPGFGASSGGGSSQAVSYVHNQGSASNTWTITHNLNFYPNVTIQDSGGTIVEGEIAYTTRNTLTATFSAAFSGKAYLS